MYQNFMSVQRDKLTNVTSPDRVNLCVLPTPVHRLDRISEQLQLEIYIKRDDLTGFGGGGNKGRKLEFLMPQILQSGAESVVTCGATQSNFIRQLAAACALYNLDFHAATMDLPFEDEPLDITPSHEGGNLYLDAYFPITRHHYPNGTWDQLDQYRDDVANSLKSQGKKVYIVKLGGSSPQGVLAFYQAGLELQKQLQPDTIITASSSGSTQVGLAHGFQNSKTKIIGIACDPEPELPHDLAKLSQEFVTTFPVGKPIAADEFDFRLDWVGPGYGVPSNAGQDAVAFLAKNEGILLDQIYSGKAFAALLELAKSKKISGKVVFWHTGGVPSLFTR